MPTVPLAWWITAAAVIVLLLAVDLVAHRRDHVVSLREAAAWSGLWIAVGTGFGALVWWRFGGEAAGEYYAGYLIEKALAVDNVFVFALILTGFAVPREYQHRVLFFGVIGALVMRTVLIASGAALIERFAWVLYLFGAFLVLTGVRMARRRSSHGDPTAHPALRLVRRLVPSTPQLHGHRFLVRRDGRWLATPLFTVLVLVEVTDLVFAVDSIPAIFAVTTEPFLVLTSNAFAVLGLRALYFLLADLMHRFVHLKLGLALVMAFVGAKMLLHHVAPVPIGVSLAVIVSIIAGSVLTSLRATVPAGRAS